MTAMLDHMKAAGVSAPQLVDAVHSSRSILQNATNNSTIKDDEPCENDDQDQYRDRVATPEGMISIPLPTPEASINAYSEASCPVGEAPMATGQETQPNHANLVFGMTTPRMQEPGTIGSLSGFQPGMTNPAEPRPPQILNRSNSQAEVDDGLSPCEARVAGVFHERGCVSSVHGLAGIINPTKRAMHKENISKVSRKGAAAVSGSKARLISNAILQKQRENLLFRHPQQSVDLDGCEPDLAQHLLNLHFNRHHCSAVITYRPAIMDSIATGGPWVNKLLLNAIYFNSSLYSDRPGLRSANNDPGSVGSRFYDRFSSLLVEAMSKPDIPSATALLLASVTLVALGKVSAGWALSGTAYRMIIDLGCHMMLGPDYQENSSDDASQMLQKDIDQEMRKRLYWGAYVIDVTQSLYLGRQCSFATTEARVPLQLLDTYEELEDWEPYQDPQNPMDNLTSFNPQPSYSVSSFISSIRLMQIGALVSDLYGVSTVNYSTDVVLGKKQAIEMQLENWLMTLPDHLVVDTAGEHIPPPRQITLHTTFHTLRILLYRAFLEEGHLRRHSDVEAKALSERECIASAMNIEKHIRLYRKSFTLRRAPFLLSYAVYSAVAIILPQERHDRGHFTDTIAFFWACLGELQLGCNFGLKKPLSVLKDMAREFQLSVQECSSTTHPQPDLGTLDRSFFPQLALGNLDGEQSLYMMDHYPGDGNPQQLQDRGAQMQMDHCGRVNDTMTPGMMNFLNDQEWHLSQNTLYGLFAPTQMY